MCLCTCVCVQVCVSRGSFDNVNPGGDRRREQGSKGTRDREQWEYIRSQTQPHIFSPGRWQLFGCPHCASVIQKSVQLQGVCSHSPIDTRSVLYRGFLQTEENGSRFISGSQNEMCFCLIEKLWCSFYGSVPDSACLVGLTYVRYCVNVASEVNVPFNFFLLS